MGIKLRKINRSLEQLSKIFILLTILVLFFQNCNFEKKGDISPDFNQNPPSLQPIKGEADGSGNAGGYTGKLVVTVPATIDQGERYTIAIEGGVAPYKISSPQGQINILNSDGQIFEVVNDFSKPVQSFEIVVIDAVGNKASARIDIIVTDNVFNFSKAASAMVTQNNYLLYDDSMNKVIVFDENGIPIELLKPYDRLKLDFLTERVVIRQYEGITYILDPKDRSVHVYDLNYKYSKTIDLKKFSSIQSSVSLTLYDSKIYIADYLGKMVHELDIDGGYLGTLGLDSQVIDYIASVAFDPSHPDRYFVSDKGGLGILVFEEGKLVSAFNSVIMEDGTQHEFLGVTDIRINSKGDIFLTDAVFKSGPYKNPINGRTGEEWVFKLNYQSSVAQQSVKKMYMRYLTHYFHHTSCLSIVNDSISVCDTKQNVALLDFDGNDVDYIYSRLGGFGTGVSEPRRIAADDEGNYFVISDYSTLVGISKDNKIMYRVNNFGANNERFNYLSSLVVIGDRLYLASKGQTKIIVLDKFSLEFLFEFNTGDGNGFGLTPTELGATEDYLIVGSGNKGIIIFDHDGNYIRRNHNFENGKIDYPKDDFYCKAMAVSKDGALYWFDNNRKRIYYYDILNDSLEASINIGENKVHALAVNDEGELLLNYDNTIQIWDTKALTKKVEFGVSGITAGAFNGILGLAAKGDFIYVSDLYNQRVQKISQTYVEMTGSSNSQ